MRRKPAGRGPGGNADIPKDCGGWGGESYAIHSRWLDVSQLRLTAVERQFNYVYSTVIFGAVRLPRRAIPS